MNILIVGNGFDLSHYLPTKYDHFMDVMDAIEQKKTGEKVTDLSIHTVDEWMIEIDKIFAKTGDANDPKYQMNFDELFSKTRDPKFIEKTKEFYLTDQIELSSQNVLKLQYRLELNCWYQYFKHHVEEIKTWIDFETKIEEGLKYIVNLIEDIDSKYQNSGKLCCDFYDLDYKIENEDSDKYYLSTLNFEILDILNLCKKNKEFGLRREAEIFKGRALSLAYSDKRIGFLNIKWFKVEENPNYGLSIEKYTNFLNQQLEDFIELFNFYLEEVVKKLKPKNEFKSLKSDDYDLTKIDHIYSFNYTQAYLDFYNSKTEVDFLHGQSGEKKNMVLGISELKDEALKKIKAYGFTKYHQKLMKDTDYKFFSENIEFIKNKKTLYDYLKDKPNEYFQRNSLYSYREKDDRLNFIQNEIAEKSRRNIWIWGHSLDVSDQDYIQEIFSFNEDEFKLTKVIIFYFNSSAKFSLLANLLHILGKEKVEHWMKQGWLKFEPNPDIAQLNQIQPVKLP